VIGLLLVALLPAGAGAQTSGGLSLEQRVERLERVLDNQSLSDILLQLQRLQQEVRQLRGELELQGHALEAQQQRQRPLYPNGDAGPTEGPSEPVSEEPWETPPAPTETPEVVEAVVAPPSSAADPTQEETQYQQAFGLLAERRYEEAVTAFQRFLATYPAGRYADLAQYWLAETHYVTREFEAAREGFTEVLDSYPQSAKAPSAMLKLGYIDYELQQWRQARNQLRQLEEQYPRSTEARLAERRLEQMRREGH
jgi:tol-pal system protein YbgF